MDIKPKDFISARFCVDYYIKVFDLEMSEEHYLFHIYNTAQQLSLYNVMPESTLEMHLNKDDFLKKVRNFKERYWEIMQNVQK